MELLEISGIGRKRMKDLNSIGIFSAEELAIRTINDEVGTFLFGREEWEELVRNARMAIGREIIRDIIEITPEEIVIETDKTYTDEKLIKDAISSLLHTYEHYFFIALDEKEESYQIQIHPVESYKHHFARYIVPNAKHLMEYIRRKTKTAVKGETKPSEQLLVKKMDSCLKNYLKEMEEERVIEFARQIDLASIYRYCEEYGGVAAIDVLLSWSQLFGIADVEVLKPNGERLTSTGFHLAFFGDIGTGKTYSSIDFVMGNEKLQLEPHGIPGRYRYCGGITPYMFLQMGQYYEGKKMVFLVPEFNEWFFHERGMVERLKLAMEQKPLKYESAHETIGPYVFTSFLNANYNVKVERRGYRLTVPDPNFRAIEDRCFCRLHRMTKERFLSIVESIERHALGTARKEEITPKLVRDHVTLLYAINTGMWKYKPAKIQFLEEQIKRVTLSLKIFAKEFVEEDQLVHASPRAIYKCLQLASAFTLPFYFSARNRETNAHRILYVDEQALKLAIEIMLEDITARTLEAISPSEVMERVIAKLYG
ncbi:MAG: hypothetical protein QXL78_04525 [Methanocellales archaeon]